MGFKKDVFGKGGMLHRAFGDGYEVREQQVNMSVDCAKAILDRNVLLAEGSTGVGKSFAYLIASVSPAIRQALIEKGFEAPIVISTSTKVLQDQIWEKDVPEILKATGQDLRVVLAKGRNNYVSARRLREFVKDVENLTAQFSTAEDAGIATRIAPVLDDQIEITLKQAEWFLKTFRTRLRKLLDLVVNDPEKKQTLIRVLNDFEKRKRKDTNIATVFFQDAHTAVQTAAEKKSTTQASSRFGYAVLTPEINDTALATMLSEYIETCQEISDSFDISLDSTDNAETNSKITLNLVTRYQSAIEIRSRLKSIVSREDTDLWCYWSEVATTADGDKESPYRLSLKRTPIDITEQIAPLFEGDNAVIFTSATLQVADNFSRIRQQLGLKGDQTAKRIIERVYPSPFPYRENVEIHLFGNAILDRPRPHATLDEKEKYLQQQTRLVEYYLRLRDGRTLVLGTSHRLLNELYEKLEPVCYDMDITPFRQIGTDKLRQTFNAFKADERSVLFGVASCWEGLDAPGSTLETVIVPQLPFAPPHPLLEARQELLPNPGEWFREISLPDMLLQLKQGAGRLVRSTTDCGVIAILSPRPLTNPYGRAIQKALPPGRLVRNSPDALKFLAN